MVTTPRWVEAPAGRPLPFGLLSLPDVVVDDVDPHTLMGVEYQTAGCSPAAALSVEQCLDIGDDSLTDDDGFDRVTGDAFTVYALHKCRNVGTLRPPVDTAVEKLDLGAGRAVESQFAVRLTDADDITPTPGTAVSIETGVGLIEEWAGDNYASVPVLHATRGSVTSMAAKGLVIVNGTHLETKLGSFVVAGAGYTDATTVTGDPDADPDPIPDQTATADERWLWVTGTVVVRRGLVDKVGPTYGLADPTNEHIALASQRYAVTSECLLGAVLVTFPGGG